MDRHQFLVETSWLAEHLHDPHLRIVDMRGYVRSVEHDGIQDAVYTGARDEYESEEEQPPTGPNHRLASLNTRPPFITKTTSRSFVMSRAGSPATATMSAS